MAAELVHTWHRNVLKPIRNVVCVVSLVMLFHIAVGAVWIAQMIAYGPWHWWWYAQMIAAAIGIASAAVAVEVLHRIRERRIEAEIEAAAHGPRFELEARSTADGIVVDVVEHRAQLETNKRATRLFKTERRLERHEGASADQIIETARARRAAFEQAHDLQRIIEPGS